MNPSDTFGRFFRRYGILFKVGVIGILCLLLLIPLSMVKSLLNERVARQQEAITDITSTWGQNQTITGPVLVAPFTHRWTETLVKDGETRSINRESNEFLFLLPEALDVKAQIDTLARHRGIYEAILFRADLTLEGSFPEPDFQSLHVDPDSVEWNRAFVALAVSDLRGTDRLIRINWNTIPVPFEPGIQIPGFTSGMHATVGKHITDSNPEGEAAPPSSLLPAKFQLSFPVNGSGSLFVTPVGTNNQSAFSSNWPDPSFGGAYLPKSQTVSTDGFEANWSVSFYGRSYPQAWTSKMNSVSFNHSVVADSAYGVRFLNLVDNYRTTERTIKYGLLFFVLTFSVYFLFEVVLKFRIHVFQYLLVGSALCLFYLAVLALSEFLAFGSAYAAGAAGCTLLITLYSLAVLRRLNRACLVGLGVAALYLFLFVILQMQDYSLLVGTIGLFIALAAIMFATRKVDWYGGDPSSDPPPIPDRK